MRPWTLVLTGIALMALAWRAFLAPFPGPGGNPYLDLIADRDPGMHRAIHLWHLMAPGVAVFLAGSISLSVSRIWFQPQRGRGVQGQLPDWPTSPDDDAPSLVIGELHHPTVATESVRPSWLVIPEKGLYTGMLVVGAVGAGKTTACMYPFARQLLTWQAADPHRRAGALVLEVKGDFCHKYRHMIARIVPCRSVIFHKLRDNNVIDRIRRALTGSLLCRVVQHDIMKYWSITDTQVGNTTCENDPLRPPSWRA